ncbi:hypothetical protein L2E82_39796 [Cichorium intybus]|uniref:Uncharacterized protein n=1 Tax=Cichorium intybus TaxID=13427 RepID=A0ACB9AJI9_CICIN|nr:hypothetical protein L2E82_39796 [Cichorium intybus]
MEITPTTPKHQSLTNIYFNKSLPSGNIELVMKFLKYDFMVDELKVIELARCVLLEQIEDQRDFFPSRNIDNLEDHIYDSRWIGRYNWRRERVAKVVMESWRRYEGWVGWGGGNRWVER